MAMGFSSTQTSSLRPSCSPYFWLSKSCPRSPHMAASYSSRSFSASTKTLHRREVCTVHGVNGIFPSITMFSNFRQLKRTSRYYTGPSFEKHRPNDAKYYDPPSSHKLSLRTEARNSSTSSTRMVPRNSFHNSAEGKQHLVETTLSKSWRDEMEKLRKERKGFANSKNSGLVTEKPPRETIMKNEQVKHLKDGSGYEKLAINIDSCSSELHDIARKEELQSSSSQGSMGYDQINRHSSSVSGGGHVFTEDHVAHGSVSPELGYRGNKYSYMNRMNSPTLDHPWPTGLSSTHGSHKGIQSNGSLPEKILDERKDTNYEFGGDRATDAIQGDLTNGKSTMFTENIGETRIVSFSDEKASDVCQPDLRKRLSSIYGKVLVVNTISAAKEVVGLLTDRYRHLVHACDTEVAKIDVKQETPVDHGEIICFSIYSGPDADFGNGKSCIWVDVLDGGGKALLVEFAPFFEDPCIKKVWHNYSFDNHVIENYGLKVSGFHADTMHMARLWDSSRRTEGGYSLEALTSNQNVMFGDTSWDKKNNKVMYRGPLRDEETLIGKVSMKTIFGRKKLKKDGSEGKISTIPPVEELQREEREPWICYSALDSISTLKLYESLKIKLERMDWTFDGVHKGSMLDFYGTYWRPFGELLVEMETEGMLVDRAYLAEVEKVAIEEQRVAANRFRNWASRLCPDAKYMNVGSDAQLRTLFFGGTVNCKNPNEFLPVERTFKVANIDKVIEEGKKIPTKFRNITLHYLGVVGVTMPTEIYTATGWPSVSGDALKTLAGKVSAEIDFFDDARELQPDDVGNGLGTMTDKVSETQEATVSEDVDTSAYGTAYAAFGEGKEGREACHAIAALCEVCSIDSLISNFILPLQGSHVTGKNGRIHCSLNINTETGRLSARRPNLQNQPALEKDRYKIRQAFIAAPGNSLIVADYGQLELRILAHLANCESMLNAFKAGGDFHSRTAMNMYPHIREAVEQKQVLLEWHPQPGEDKPPVPILKDAFGSERRKAKMLNFSIAYGKTPVGLARDWKVSVKEAKETVDLWYKDRKEVLKWQEERKQEARSNNRVHTLLGRARCFPSSAHATYSQRGHIDRAAINTPVQGSAADVAMCAMLEISRNEGLKELGWRLLLQVHDEVILEGPTESAEVAKAIVVECMSKPFNGKNILKVDLSVDAKCAQNWYSGK